MPVADYCCGRIFFFLHSTVFAKQEAGERSHVEPRSEGAVPNLPLILSTGVHLRHHIEVSRS